MTRLLLPGTIDAAGRIDPTPVIVTLDSAGKVTDRRSLDGHEPHSTEFRRALLSLPDLTLRPL